MPVHHSADLAHRRQNERMCVSAENVAIVIGAVGIFVIVSACMIAGIALSLIHI